MKRRVLKKWVVILLFLINVAIFCLFSAEYSDVLMQIVLSIVGLSIFALNSHLIAKYGNL